ncbi:MAG: formylglycine-generating enzyme family protein [Thermoguttaceae bacterium]
MTGIIPKVCFPQFLRLTSFLFLIAISVLSSAISTRGAEQAGSNVTPNVEQVPFSPNTFKTGEDCKWSQHSTSMLKFPAGDLYIAKPENAKSRDTWLKAAREYRQFMRGELPENAPLFVEIEYNGVRAWLRMENDLAKAYDIMPDDKLVWKFEARYLSGNDELCAAFDFPQRDTNNWVDWSTVNDSVKIPTDGNWHTLEITQTVPKFDSKNLYARPMLGMDATHDPAKGHVQIRNATLEIISPTESQKESLTNVIPNLAKQTGIDRSLYDEKSQKWLQGAFTCHFTFMYDKSFYDPSTIGYQIDSFLEDGEKEFGGYDVILLWHAYPRIGVDHRNQLDFYRDMPGGAEAIREIVNECHERGVKVFINYNPWDTGTHREGKTDEDFLVDFVLETQVDGIFLDTMVGDSPILRQKLDAVRPGITLSPEGNPSILDLGICNSSWAQWCDDPVSPSLDLRKWLEPRHMRWQIWRWNLSHREEIRRAFFGGGGMIVWENVFGVHNPWNAADRFLWKRAVSILKQFTPLFTSDAWEPYYPAAWESDDESVRSDALNGLYIHKWPGKNGETIFTLWYEGKPLSKKTGPVAVYDRTDYALFEVPYNPQMRYYDLWNGKEIFPERSKNNEKNVVIRGMIDRHSDLGCFIEIPKESVTINFNAFLNNQANMASESTQKMNVYDNRNESCSVSEPPKITRTPTTSEAEEKVPAGMSYVPGSNVRMQIEHMRRECGCYSDPDTPADLEEVFTWGHVHNTNMKHDFEVEVKSFMIDQTEVSNAEFKRFLDATGYEPEHDKNFLAHWPSGVMPAELADHPVVYVDINDAKAYAEWAGKRLPTEAEWHLAAQGTDGRIWPWGNEEPNEKRVNQTDGTLPVNSLPDGRSPFGCYNMSGNVYEWTDSERDDAHTRFAIIRGGSYFQAKGSGWYMDGGARPNTHHAKFILMWPGLDRCDTIGFRCVKDIK